VWQKAKALCVDVYRISARGRLARDFGLRDQMQRAAVSVMSNIAEGFDRNSRAEFARFLAIARGSAGELRSRLYLARELDYIGEDDFEHLVAGCIETTKMLVSLRKSLGA
jgi:four helix bundle protein